jgi:hypothetical protein
MVGLPARCTCRSYPKFAAPTVAVTFSSSLPFFRRYRGRRMWSSCWCAADLRLAPRRWTQCKACYKRFTPPIVQALCCRFQGPCRSSSNGDVVLCDALMALAAMSAAKLSTRRRPSLLGLCNQSANTRLTPLAPSSGPGYPSMRECARVLYKTRNHREGEHFDWLHPRCLLFFSAQRCFSLGSSCISDKFSRAL